MTKTVKITINIKTARTMLGVAGFNSRAIAELSDDEVFEKVLRMIECYGATSIVSAPKDTNTKNAICE